MQLLRSTPPNGDAFAASVASLLQRESVWIRWKQAKCPNYVSPPAAAASAAAGAGGVPAAGPQMCPLPPPAGLTSRPDPLQAGLRLVGRSESALDRLPPGSKRRIIPPEQAPASATTDDAWEWRSARVVMDFDLTLLDGSAVSDARALSARLATEAGKRQRRQ